jgi:Flp pilus assembly protein TadB
MPAWRRAAQRTCDASVLAHQRRHAARGRAQQARRAAAHGTRKQRSDWRRLRGRAACAGLLRGKQRRRRAWARPWHGAQLLLRLLGLLLLLLQLLHLHVTSLGLHLLLLLLLLLLLVL